MSATIVPSIFLQQAASNSAIDLFDRNFLDLIHYMHSGVGVFHPNGSVSLDTFIMATHSSAQRKYILWLLHSNLILNSLDG